MYIFGYLFQEWHFKGSSKKRAHRKKTFFWGGGSDDPPALLLRRACNTWPNSFLKVSIILKFLMLHSNLFHSIQKQPPKLFYK